MMPIEHGDAVQLTLPTIIERPDRPKRRQLWRTELGRAIALHADQRARDRCEHEAQLARVDRQLEDVRARLIDLERATIADIAIAPRTAARLRAYAGNGS